MTAPNRAKSLIALALLAGSSPVRAEVIAQDQPGFVSRNVVVVAGSPAAVWKRLVALAGWWSSVHTFSGDAANLTLDPVAGGCFCEKLPADDDSAAKPGAPHPPARGGVEHMRVVFVDHAKALRMVGALGPLQSEAVNATLTVTLKPVDGGTRVIFEYVVGGYMRYPADKISHAVDAVMGEQLLALAKLFGEPVPVAQTPAPAPAPSGPAAPAPVIKGGLGKDGLLLPRGKVWSLPASDTAAPPPAPLPDAPTVAPLPSLPVAPDASVAAGATASAPAPADPAPQPKITVVPVAESTIAPEPATAAEVAPPPATPPEAAPAPAPVKKPARAKAKPAAKPAPKPVQAAEPADGQPSRSAIDSALDAAFPGAPPKPQ